MPTSPRQPVTEDPEVEASTAEKTGNNGKSGRGPATSRAVSWLPMGFAVGSWVIWQVFIKNIAADPRSFRDRSPTAFFAVHLVLTVVSLVFAVISW
jgi:hypothetical protein